jgi:hypothetical protein
MSLNEPKGFARFDDFLSQAPWLAVPERPQSLYHYTSAKGMQAIVSSGVLRAYNLGKMNDFAECRYAASVMRAHIDRCYAVEPNSVAMDLFGAMRQRLTDIDISTIFALSLTADGDEMGMWRLYADHGRGFSFEIPFAERLWQGQWGMPVKCIYDFNSLTSFCKQMLIKIREIYLSDVDAGVRPDPEGWANTFFRSIAWFAPAFKPEVWCDEQEWRLIFLKRSSFSILPNTTLDDRSYIELPLRVSKKNPIISICAGPVCDYEDDILPLRRILCEKGYGANFPIQLSMQHTPSPRARTGQRRIT